MLLSKQVTTILPQTLIKINRKREVFEASLLKNTIFKLNSRVKHAFLR
jgi:hypothetical protein